jgi:putative transposase
MNKSKFTESQITGALKEYEAGKKVEDICRQLSINHNTFYNWKKKYSGMDAELLRKFKDMERENAELKRMYADLSLDHRILKNVIEKKL